MPEGDTIYRAAVRLREVMMGHRIENASSPRRAVHEDSLTLLEGTVVQQVESRGKHLLLHLDNNRCIHSHMGMHGAWHIYPRKEDWLKPAEHAALILECNSRHIACFYPKTLEVLTSGDLRRHQHLLNLGPDLLAPDFDIQHVLERLRERGQLPVGEAIMDQRIVSGIGNVYKSELLFELGLNPFIPVADLQESQLLALVERARKQLRRNSLVAGSHPRRQTRMANDGSRFWVYGRLGELCLRCGQRIRMDRQGNLKRSTYWCPECQPSRDGN